MSIQTVSCGCFIREYITAFINEYIGAGKYYCGLYVTEPNVNLDKDVQQKFLQLQQDRPDEKLSGKSNNTDKGKQVNNSVSRTYRWIESKNPSPKEKSFEYRSYKPSHFTESPGFKDKKISDKNWSSKSLTKENYSDFIESKKKQYKKRKINLKKALENKD